VSQTPMETFTIFTTAANELLELIHERGQLILYPVRKAG
jgi:putative SOS response-associated peptidase YedK